MNAPPDTTLGVAFRDCLWLFALVAAVGSVYAWDRWQGSPRVASSPVPGGPKSPPPIGDLVTPVSPAPEQTPAEPPVAAEPAASPPPPVEPPSASAPRPVDDVVADPKTVAPATMPESPAPSTGLAVTPPAQVIAEEQGPAKTIAGTKEEDVPVAKIQPLEPETVADENKPKLAMISSTLPPPNQLDYVVDQFIQYDVGQLRGEPGQQALMAFNRLGTESVPALIRGLHRAACISASCPVIVLASKLSTTLRSSGPEMTELALGQLGAGVPPAAPHYHRLESLKQQLFALLPGDHPLRRRIELAGQLAASPARVPQYVRSADPNERWAAARAVVLGGAPLGDELIQLLGDTEPVIVQEARAGLMRLANKDFGPAPDADSAAHERALADWRSWWFKRSNSTIFRRVSRLTDAQLRQALASDDAEERWAAVVTVGNRRLPYAEELTGLLRDPDRLVRRDARKTLVQLADGADYGPTDDEDPAAVDAAVAKWQQWCRLQTLIAQYQQTAPDELVAAFTKADPLERLAAVRVAHARKLDRPEAFIQSLEDPQPEISQEARHALVRISGGADFGPSENADQEAARDSVARWQRWLQWHRLVVAYGSKSEAEVVQIFRSAEPLERWAAVSVSRRKAFRPGAALIELLRDGSADVQQEARQALVELGAGDYDFGPPDNSDPPRVDRAVERWTTWWQRETLLPPLLGLPPEDLAAAFHSPDVPQRWAAIAAARRVRAPLQPDLISLLRDADQDVRQEARRALAQWAGGSDFGPPENADSQAIETAAGQWEKWWAGEKERREAAAAGALKLARIVLETNPNAARKRLHDVVMQFAGTEAAQTAQGLLDKVPQVAPADRPREKPASTGSRPAKKRADLVAEPVVKVAPGQLENEAGLMLRLAKMTLSHRPEMLRQRLAELIDRYPGTKAAQEAQRLFDSPAAKPAPAGNAAKEG
jgi:HEAT repeat protein